MKPPNNQVHFVGYKLQSDLVDFKFINRLERKIIVTSCIASGIESIEGNLRSKNSNHQKCFIIIIPFKFYMT
jgi:hypothetical protein